MDPPRLEGHEPESRIEPARLGTHDVRAHDNPVEAACAAPALRGCDELAAQTVAAGHVIDHQAEDLRRLAGLQKEADAHVDPAQYRTAPFCNVTARSRWSASLSLVSATKCT
jgi:hypothetical protein